VIPMAIGGGRVRPKSNILTYNQPDINPFCLYPQIYPALTREFGDQGEHQQRTHINNVTSAPTKAASYRFFDQYSIVTVIFFGTRPLIADLRR
ncbi:MAG: hypothetical protein WBY84_15865, partial [Pseudolabrys sp.]